MPVAFRMTPPHPLKQPPFPRPSSVVDPRIGDVGPALLALEDGRVFPGIAFGAPVRGQGDLVVNTSQTGYQEIATDPSYAGQVVVMTYPLIGNYGRLHADDQSERPWLRGLVVANATAAVPRRRPPAGHHAARGGDTGDRRRGHPSPGPTPPRERVPAGDRDRARRDGPRRGSRAGPSRAPMGGPGLRGAGLADRSRATKAIHPRAARW